MGLCCGASYGESIALENGYIPADGWEYWKYVVGYGIVYAAIGTGVGYCVGTVFTAAVSSTTAAVTVGTSPAAAVAYNTVITEIYCSWQSAEYHLRSALDSVVRQAERTFYTVFGPRIVDAYNQANGIIAESKYGYQGLSSFIQSEIDRDVWLLQHCDSITKVEWHFYYSIISESAGPSDSLFAELIANGIEVVYHY